MKPENKEQEVDQPAIGSTEPLTDEQTRARLRQLEDWGVDLTLVRASLDRTPTERVLRMLELLEFSRALSLGYVRHARRVKNRAKGET